MLHARNNSTHPKTAQLSQSSSRIENLIGHIICLTMKTSTFVKKKREKYSCIVAQMLNNKMFQVIYDTSIINE